MAEGTAKKIVLKALRPKTPQVFYLGRDQSISWQIFSVLDKYHDGLGNSLSSDCVRASENRALEVMNF